MNQLPGTRLTHEEAGVPARLRALPGVQPADVADATRLDATPDRTAATAPLFPRRRRPRLE